MEEIKNQIKSIDSKLAEVNNLIHDLYVSVETSHSLKDRDNIIKKAIAETLETDNEEFIQSYFEIIRDLDLLFE